MNIKLTKKQYNQLVQITQEQKKYLEFIGIAVAIDRLSDKPVNSKILQAFCETQNRALDKLNEILEAHKDIIEKIVYDTELENEKKQGESILEEKTISIKPIQIKRKSDTSLNLFE